MLLFNSHLYLRPNFNLIFQRLVNTGECETVKYLFVLQRYKPCEKCLPGSTVYYAVDTRGILFSSSTQIITNMQTAWAVVRF